MSRSSLLLALFLSPWAGAAPLTWDVDPATAGAQDGAGTWDDVATNWWDGAANTNWLSANPDDATLGAGGSPGLITLAGPLSIGSLTFASVLSGSYAITGSTITLAAPSTINAATNGTIGSVLAGGGLVKTGNGTLTLTASNSFAGGTTVSAGMVDLGDDAALGGGAVTLDGGSIRRNVAGAVITNAVVVGSGGEVVGRLVVDAYMTLAGPVSGGGPLGITGLVALANAGNSYTGAVSIRGTSSYLKLAVDNALSNNPVTFAGGSLTLSMGTTSTVGSLTGTAGSIFNQLTNPATLFIGGGDQSGVYAGSVNNGGGPMHIVKIGTGTQEFSTAAGTSLPYGSLTVQAGQLRLNGAGYVSSVAGGNGSGTPILVKTGATLQVANYFNTGFSRPITIDGGVLNLTLSDVSAGNGGDGGNYINNLTLMNGAQVTGTRTRVGFNSAASITVTGSAPSTLAAGITLVVQGTSPLTLQVADVTTNLAADLTISGLISDFPSLTGMPVIKAGAGSVLISGTNLYAGTTTIAQGTILVRSGNALGAATSPVILGSPATGAENVELASANAGGDLIFTRPVTVTTNGAGAATIGGRHAGGRAFFDGVVTINRDTTLLGSGNDRTQFRGGLLGTGRVVITGGNRVTWSTTTGTTEFGNGAAGYTFVGDILITNAGTVLQLNSDFTAGNQSLGGKSLQVATDAFLRLPYDADATFNALTGNGVVEAYAPGGGAAGNFLTVGAAGGSGTFEGRVINTGGATLHLVKQGAGTQTLAGANTYSGTTLVSTGTLALAGLGSISNSPSITVSSGAVFDVSAASFTLGGSQTLLGAGSVTGAFVAAPGARIIPGATNTAGTLTFNGSLSLGAISTNIFNLGSDPSNGNDRIVVNGDLNPGGSAVQIVPLAPLTNGTYTLLTYTGIKSGSFDPVLRGAAQVRQSLALDESIAQQVNLTVTGAPAALVWSSITSANWDVAASTNWLNTGTVLPDLYFQGDQVRFDDTPGVTTAVFIAASLLPGPLTVAADTNAFVLSGPGGLAGSFVLTKAGTNSFTVSTTNSYGGTTIVSNGTVIAGANAAFGTSALVLEPGTTLARTGAGASLGNPIALAGGLVTLDDAGGSLTLTNTVSGPAGLLKRGGGTVTLGAANTITGVQVLAGTLALNNAAALGSGPVSVSANATLNLGVYAATNAVSLEGGTLALNGGVTFTLPVTLAAGVTNTLRATGNYVVMTGTLAGAGGFVVAGTGVPGLQLCNPSNSFLGNVEITGGSFLRLTASEVIPDTATVTVQSNGNIRLEGGGLTETIAGLTGRGQVWIPTIGDHHTLRIGATDASSVFDGQIGVSGQHLTITLAKIGAGTLTLNGSNSYVSATSLEGGTLVVNGYTATGAIFVAGGTTLGGTGAIGGSVYSDGVVAPGVQPGRLAIAGDFSQSDGARLALDLAGNTAGSYDMLALGGAATLDGELSVTNVSYSPAFGDSFTVLTAAAVSGVFATTNLPPLPPTNAWQVTYRTNEVVLDVVFGAPPPPYEVWALAITNPALRGDQEDADGDGLPNLWEYSQGTDPTNALDGLKVLMARTNNVYALKFNRVTAAVDVVYSVEAAYTFTNNALWEVIASNQFGLGWEGDTSVTETNAGPVLQVFAEDNDPAAPARGLRLRVHRP